MIQQLLPLFLIFCLTSLIGFYVLRANTAGIPHRAFAFFAFSVAAWTLSIAVTHNFANYSTTFARASFASASLMVLGLLLLFRTFPQESTLRWDWVLSALALVGVTLSVLSFTPLIASSATLGGDGLRLTYGPLHPIYALYIYSCFGVALLVLGRKYRASVGLVKLQFKYLLLGLILPGFGVTLTNLLIPMILGSSRTGQYGPYFALIFLGFTAHALIRYRFMDIRLVLQRGVTFLLAFIVSVSVLAGILFLVSTFLPFSIQPSQVVFLITGSVIISILLPLLRGLLGRLLDRYVYRVTINYQRTVWDASRTLATILNPDELVSYTVRTALALTGSKRAALYLRDGVSFHLRSEEAMASASSPTQLSPESLVVEFVSRSREALVAEEVPKRLTTTTGIHLTAELAAHDWAVVLPIHSERTLQALIVIGPKSSGDPFFPDEIEFLSILTSQVAIALQNAQLYKQVVIANEHVANILATIDSGVLAIDSNRHLTLSNRAAERLAALSAATVRRQDTRSLPPTLSHLLEATLEDGQPRTQVESVLIDEDDRLTPILCSTSALRDGRGTILGAVVVFSDLSRLKELEREKRRAQRLASSSALASGIAHEIKNPLVAIRTFAELLPERFREVDFREDFSKVVIGEIDRIDGLVARLRGIAAPSPQVAGAVDIRRSIVDTLVLLRARLEQTHTVVHREFEHPAPVVAVDDGKLKQLFLNILLNGIEAMGAGGELTIKISGKERHDTSWVVVEVTDTGPGIPEPTKVHIFEPFFSTKTRGSGLGLAICRGITDAHRGTIRAENSVIGRGTTIIVEFPDAGHSLQLIQETAATGSQNS